MKNVLFGSIILLCVTLSVCAIVHTFQSRVTVKYRTYTGYKEVNIDASSNSIEGALDDVRDIDSIWNSNKMGKHYYR